MAYAETTSVPVERSIAEIVAAVKKAGAQRIVQAEEPGRFAVQFTFQDRTVRFRVALPELGSVALRDGRGLALSPKQRQARLAQAHRQRARALLLVLKAKLESVESGVETFEQAFLPHVVLSTGETVYERIAPQIALEHAKGERQVLMLTGPEHRG